MFDGSMGSNIDGERDRVLDGLLEDVNIG